VSANFAARLESSEPVPRRGQRDDPVQGYEAYAIRYASRVGLRSEAFHGFHLYGEPEGPHATDYYFWLVRSSARVVLVDCGYSLARARRRGRYLRNEPNLDPVVVLAEFGVEPESVDEVIVSHLHYDHVGNLDRFPNAHFTVARAELEFWDGAYGDRGPLPALIDADELEIVRRLCESGRVQLVDGPQEVLPGIVVLPVSGHTPGCLVTAVRTQGGAVVLASDAAHFYEEFGRDRPFWLFSDLCGMFDSYDLFRALDSMPGVVVVPGHDPEVMRRFDTSLDGKAARLDSDGAEPHGGGTSPFEDVSARFRATTHPKGKAEAVPGSPHQTSRNHLLNKRFEEY
jgi:glyoxylase-like metal-dependent hydrolase (beta-lactamase superfamily II)